MTGPLLIDAHVHLHAGQDPARVLAAALRNGRAAAAAAGLPQPSVALVIVDTPVQDGFQRLRAGAAGWHPVPTGEAESIRLRRDDGEEVLVLAGRQMATRERLEVLSLLSAQAVPDGLDLTETVRRVQQAGGLPVIPWGFGKWSLRRRALLEGWLTDPPRPVFLGDSGGRPALMAVGDIFVQAAGRRIWNLPGSDPLFLPWEIERAGSCGFVLPEGLPADRPAEALRRRLLELTWQPVLVGGRRSLAGFLRSQIGLRLPRQGAAGAAAVQPSHPA